MIMTDESCKYSLIPLIHNPQIDPGDEVKIDVYIVGTGNVERSQLFIVHSHPILIADNIGRITTSMTIDKDDDVISGSEAIGHRSRTTHDLTDAGGHYTFDNRYFSQIQYDERTIDRLDFSVSYLETRHDGIPPLQYRLQTDSSAAPGEYTISLVLTYESKHSVVHQDRQDIKIHVNSKAQQLEPIPTIVGIIAALIALISLILTAISVASTAGVISG